MICKIQTSLYRCTRNNLIRRMELRRKKGEALRIVRQAVGQIQRDGGRVSRKCVAESCPAKQAKIGRDRLYAAYAIFRSKAN